MITQVCSYELLGDPWFWKPEQPQLCSQENLGQTAFTHPLLRKGWGTRMILLQDILAEKKGWATRPKGGTTISNLLRKIVPAAILVLGASAVFVGIRLRLDKREARQLILDAARLGQNDGSINLSDFLAKHGKSMHAIRDCNEEQCTYAADLRNAPLPLLHLASPAEFYISVIGKRGQVQEVYVSAKTSIAGKPYAATIRSVSATQCMGGCKDFLSDAVVDATGKILVSTIELGPGATLADRRIAFQLNADCIFEMKGCSNPLQITGGWPIRAVD